MPDFFGYQTHSQSIRHVPTNLRIDAVTVSSGFSVKCRNRAIKIKQSGLLTASYTITWEFPVEADTIKYWATLNGKVVPGSVGQTAVSGGFVGQATRSTAYSVFVQCGDILQHFALSSTGADFTFIPAVPVKCDMLEAISGGFSVQLSTVKEKPCQSSSSSRKCFPKKRRVRKI